MEHQLFNSNLITLACLGFTLFLGISDQIKEKNLKTALLIT